MPAITTPGFVLSADHRPANDHVVSVDPSGDAMLRIATTATYDAAKELVKATVLHDAPEHRAASLNAADRELRLALDLVSQLRRRSAEQADPAILYMRAVLDGAA